MPQPKSMLAYAPEFLELAERMQAHPTEVIFVPCPSMKDAIRLRFRLYGFQKAMEHELEPGAFLFTHAEIRLAKDSPGLELEPRESNKDAVILRAALHPTKD